MKRFFSVILLGICMLNLTIPMFALDYPEEEVLIEEYQYMSSIDMSLHYSQGTGTASVNIWKLFGITQSLEATLTVYKKVGSSWVYVDSTSGSSTTTNLGIQLNFTAVYGCTYKAVAEVTATGENGSEDDTRDCERRYI